jgi:hypothetical protein
VNASDVTEADTLDTVTTRGNTTANSITVGSVTAAGLSNLLGQIRTFATTGNTYIGANPGSATDAGFKLDVNGTTRLNGNTTVTGVLTGSDTIRSTNGTVTVSLSYGSTAGIIGTTSNHSLEIRTNNTYRVGVSTAGVVNIANLIGTGSRMVVADSAGNLSTQAIPDLSGYLPLSGGTLTGGLIGTTGSFASSGSGDTFAINHSSGSGIALNITKGGNGEGLYINKTGGSGNAATIIGTLNATTLVKSGGTSSQFLKADGSVDSNTYATDSSVVHISGTETITGAKTFSNVTTFNQNIVCGIIKLSQGVLLSKSAAVGTDAGFLSLIATSATGLNYINIADGDAPSNTQRFAIPNTGTYTYTFPAASGTVALASDIPSLTNYVTLDGTQTITGLKTFSGLLTANGNIKATYYGFADSNGYSTGFESQSNNTIQVKIGSGLAINIASNNNTTFYGNIIRNGGTSSQFLKADGSLDSSTYLTSASVSGVYLPLAGGTLTGALNGTSAVFSGDVSARNVNVQDGYGLGAGNFQVGGISGNRFYIYNGTLAIDNITISPSTGVTTFARGISGTSATFSGDVGAGGYVISSNQVIANNAITTPTNDNTLTNGTVIGLNGITTVNNYGIGVSGIRNGNYDIWFQTGSINGGGYRFYKGTSEIFTITSGGNVGINTTNPTYLLDVNGTGRFGGNITLGEDGTYSGTYYTVGFSGSANGSNRIFAAKDGSDGIYIASATGTFIHLRAGGGSTNHLLISNTGAATFSANVNSYKSFEVNNSNNTSGNGTITSILGANCNNTSSYHFIGYTGTSDRIYIYGNGNIVNSNNSYGALSDIRLKENITDTASKLADLLKVKVRNYNLIGDDKKQIGVIAQELESIFPGMIETDGKSGMKQVKYSVFVPMLIKAMQEQQAQIEQLKSK